MAEQQNRLVKQTIRLFSSDLAFLRRVYGSFGGYNVHVRTAVHVMCDRLRAAEAARGETPTQEADDGY